jgi:hypothetical protein
MGGLDLISNTGYCILVGIAPDDSKDAFSLFARQYPFLVTKSTKAASIPSYPAEVCKQIPAVFVAKKCHLFFCNSCLLQSNGVLALWGKCNLFCLVIDHHKDM